jgi:hypothetical protein
MPACGARNPLLAVRPRDALYAIMRLLLAMES